MALETGKKAKTRRRLICALSVLLAIVVVLGGTFATYAWLVLKEKKVENKVVVTDVGIACNLYFVPGSGSGNTVSLDDLEKATPYRSNGDSMISVSLSEAGENYIGNLRVVVRFQGGSPAYIRVKILEQWTSNDTFIPASLTPYTIPSTRETIFGIAKENWLTRLFPSWQQENNLNVADENFPDGGPWFDNRKEDFCYYYRVPVYPLQTGDSVSMLLINGIAPGSLTNRSGELKLIIEAEAVQPNRFREFFHLDQFPWENQ